MGFIDALENQLHTSGGERSTSTRADSKLVNPILKVNKQLPEVTVRILPPARLGDNYNVAYRNTFISTPNPEDPSKQLYLNAILPVTRGDSILEKAVAQWQAEGRMPNKYKKAPTTRYFMNVVKIINVNGQLVEERNKDGKLNVCVMDVPYGVITALNGLLIDNLNRPSFPEGTDSTYVEYSFVSPVAAFPVTIKMPTEGSKALATILRSNIQLGPLPTDFLDSLEDLEYQATPSESLNPEYVHKVVAAVNGPKNVTNAVASIAQYGLQQQQPQGQPQGQPTNYGYNQPVQEPNFQREQPQGQPTNYGYNQPPATNYGYAQQVPQNAPTGAKPAPNSGYNQQVAPSYYEGPTDEGLTITDDDLPFLGGNETITPPTESTTTHKEETATQQPPTVETVAEVDALLKGMGIASTN